MTVIGRLKFAKWRGVAQRTGFGLCESNKSPWSATQDPMPISRILIVSDYAGSRGGCELLAQTFRRGLRERGVDAYLLASSADAFEQDQAPDGLFWGTSGS